MSILYVDKTVCSSYTSASLQALPLLRPRIRTNVPLYACNADNIQYAVYLHKLFPPAHAFLTAIVASLLLFATFGIGCKCFHDFGRGLQSSKMHGQYYKPIATQLKETLLGKLTFPIRSDVGDQILTLHFPRTPRRSLHGRPEALVQFRNGAGREKVVNRVIACAWMIGWGGARSSTALDLEIHAHMVLGCWMDSYINFLRRFAAQHLLMTSLFY